MKPVIAYIATAVTFFALDFIWLSTMANGFYRDRLGGLLMDKPNLTVAGLFYLVYVGGIVYFAVLPAVAGGGWTLALVSGLILGLVAYGTYDFTNLSTINNWSWQVTVVDLAWGMALTAVAAVVGTLVTARLAA